VVIDATGSSNFLGPDPEGATPLSDDDVKGLIPDFVTNHAELNEVEFENIAKSLAWARTQARDLRIEELLSVTFLTRLHRRMFEDVWTWAGKIRTRLTNIGSDPELIVSELGTGFGDFLYWHENSTYELDEQAVRIHVRLVTIHPFPNGNGRCTRLFADVYRIAAGGAPFTWGSAVLERAGAARSTYMDALLRAAQHDEFDELVAFART
jgi:Fic-DOC domain mobile mystery protein B